MSHLPYGILEIYKRCFLLCSFPGVQGGNKPGTAGKDKKGKKGAADKKGKKK